MSNPLNITFINAGAGSGKTYRLTELLYQSLFDGLARPERVIATTFTRKAAAELRERARGKLMEHGAWLLSQQIGAARIGTVNSVCGDLLQRFAFEAGVSTDLRVLDENQSVVMFRKSLDSVLELSTRQSLNALAMRLGIQDRFGNVIWEERVLKVVEQARANAIAPSSLSAMAEENAQDLLGHFGKPLGKDSTTDLQAKLRDVIPLLQAEQAKRSVKDTAAYLDLCLQAQKALRFGGLPWSDWVKLSKGVVGANSRNHVASLCLTAGGYLKHPGFHQDIRDFLRLVFEVAAAAMEVYAGQKRDMGLIDFIDQEQLLLGALELEPVAEALAGDLDLLLVDEFQDTSPIQLAIFLKLAALAKKTYWVGDPKQSIYGFRGSDPELMHQVRSLVSSQEILGDSWRSTPSLVALNNAVFKKAFHGQYKVEEIVLNARRPDPAGSPAALLHWQLQGSNESVRGQSLAQGVRRLLVSGAKVVDRAERAERPLRCSDIAILTRSNDKVSDLADALSQAGVPVAIEQAGLLGTPEAVLALACLRRLNDPYDTLATAEIVSLVTSASPEVWLTDRLAWLKQHEVAHHLWKEEGDAPLPLLQQLAGMRSSLAVLSPREAMQRVITLCNLSDIVTAWRPESAIVRQRLDNLQQLVELAGQYEEECRSSASAATVSGLLLWLGELADNELDTRALSSVDAVQIMTYHKSKGLEWPVVVCTDLNATIKSRLWDISTASRNGFDAAKPLQGRFIRYWPWPFGLLKKIDGLAGIEESPIAVTLMSQATQEAQRLLYVGMTRARDRLVLALGSKETADQGWLGSLGCGEWLNPQEDADTLALPDGSTIPYGCKACTPEEKGPGVTKDSGTTYWFNLATGVRPGLPMMVSPSAIGSSGQYGVLEEVRLDARIPLAGSIQGEMDRLGTGLHACIAFAVSQQRRALSGAEVTAIMSNLGMASWLDAERAAQQITAFLEWIHQRWQPVACHAELPVQQILAGDTGQILRGQIDLLLETADGWILIDHKSNPGGQAGWEGLAVKHGGQLQAYREAVERVSGKPVLESWLYLPVSGAAVRVGERA